MTWQIKRNKNKQKTPQNKTKQTRNKKQSIETQRTILAKTGPSTGNKASLLI